MQPFAGVGKEVVGRADRRARLLGTRIEVGVALMVPGDQPLHRRDGERVHRRVDHFRGGGSRFDRAGCGFLRPMCSHRRTVKHARRTSVAAVPLPVVAGAQLMCSFGVAPSAFMVTPEGKTLFENKPAATIMDNVPFKNIMPFGVCTSLANPITAAQTAAALGVLTPGTCIPVIPAPWVPPCPTVLVANKPAFNQTAKCMCAYGGVIQVLNPGATTEQIP